MVAAHFKEMHYIAIYIIDGFDAGRHFIEKHGAAAEVGFQVAFVGRHVLDYPLGQPPLSAGVF
jgi:hypothetical protein